MSYKDIEYQRKWRAANKEKMKQYAATQKLKGNTSTNWAKRRSEETALQHIERTWSKRAASKRVNGYDFTVAFADVNWPSVCPVLGTVMDYEGESYNETYSLDRLDSTKGYVKGNVFVISRKANRLKNNATADELRKIATWMDSASKASGRTTP